MSHRDRLTAVQANALYDVVVHLAGANESARDQWLAYTSHDESYEGGLEFRFGGFLGSGGKLIYNGYKPAHVTCEPRNLDAKTKAIVAATNAALSAVPHPRRAQSEQS